ncbi:MAG: GEVED domain-containing protein [Chitinophagales bacterium]
MIRKVIYLLLLVCCSFSMTEIYAVCNMPTGFFVSNIGYTHVNVQWQNSVTALAYNVRIRQSGTSTWQNTQVFENQAIFYTAPCTSYELQIQSICEDEELSSFSPSLFVTSQGCNNSFCYSYGENTDYEWIESVSIHTLNNLSGVNYGYADFTNLVTDLQQGQSYLMNLTPAFSGTPFAEYWRVWIDFNGDNDFEDANELVYDGNNVSTNAVQAFINIPSGITTGFKRMRVSMKFVDFGDNPPQACESFAFGETEDYTINISGFSCSSPQINLTSISTSCGENNGVIGLNVFGGTPPYTYQWNTGQNTASLNNLSSGFYAVTVTDALDCSNNTQTVISASQNVAITDVNLVSASCGQNNGSALLSVTGNNLSYEWSHNSNLNSPLANGLAAGVYSITLSDNNNCSDEISITINNNDGLDLNVAQQNNASCGENNGNVQVVATNFFGAVTYNWSHNVVLNSSVATNLVAGVYSVTATDSNNCSDIVVITINEATAPNLIALTSENATCGLANGSLNVIASGGTGNLSFFWSNGIGFSSNQQNNLAAGIYNVTVTDAANCSFTASGTVVGISGPTINNISSNNAACGENNGSIFIDATIANGTLNYEWSHSATLNSPLANNLAAGNYTVTISESNQNCELVESINISGTTDISATINQNAATCSLNNGIAIATATGGTAPYTYVWSNNTTSNFVNNLGAGLHTVTITDNNDCILIETISIISENPFSINAFVDNATCEQANGNAILSLNNGTAPYDIVWSNGQTGTTASNLAAGTYGVTVTDVNGCLDIKNNILIANQNSQLSAEIDFVEAASCGENNGSINLNILDGEAPYEINWSVLSPPNSSSLSNLANGNYSVTINDAWGCETVLVAEVPLISEMDLITENTSSICEENSGSANVLIFGGVAPYEILWSNGSTTPDINNVSDGNYEVSITDAFDCLATANVQVISASIPSVDLGADTLLISMGETAILDATTENVSYEWSTGEINNIISVQEIGNYSVTVTDLTSNCIAIDELIVLHDDVGFLDKKNALNWQVYPNPFEEKLFIEIENNHFIHQSDSQVIVADINGKEYYKEALNCMNSIDFSTLSLGIYFVYIINGNDMVVKKVLKK